MPALGEPAPIVAEIDPTEGLTTMLRRLVAVWRATRVKLGLPMAASFTDIARRLDVDRGTAQRLNRIGKLADAGPGDLEQFPGVRAWHRVLVGAKQALGEDDLSVVALGQACEQFAEYLAAAGGSRSAVVRHLKGDGGNGMVPEAGQPPRDGVPLAGTVAGTSGSAAVDGGTAEARAAAWVRAAANVVGYCADVRLDVQMVRELPAPADGSPRYLELAMVNVLHGCRGRPGAMPLAFTRQARPPTFAAADATTPLPPAHPHPFRLLRAGTSRPTPTVLTTGDEVRHTIFVEPQWATSPDALDLALLQADPAPVPSPWGVALERLEFACVNRHPCRRLVLDRLVGREKDAVAIPSLGAFRSHHNLSHDEPWFDRLPQDGVVRRVGTVAEAIALPDAEQPFPDYAAVLSEAVAELNWPAEELILYRATVENPIPLATYTLMFDHRKP